MKKRPRSQNEIKHPGMVQDFTGTWWVKIPLTSFSETIVKWAETNIPKEHLASASLGCKGGIEQSHHVNVLMGLPHPPTPEFIKYIQSTIKFKLQFGQIKSFPGAKGEEDTYRVLYVEIILPNAPLFNLQSAIGRIAVRPHQDAIRWHHPVYNPHCTVAWIDSKYRHLYEGQNIISESDGFIVDHVEVRKYKSTETIIIPFSDSCLDSSRQRL